MIEVRRVDHPDTKSEITLKIMNALPEWFSPPEDIVHKAVIHREYPFFAAFSEEGAVGFAALKLHNEYTADIYDLGVLKQYHRQGVGHQLVEACIRYCQEQGYKFLTVKTLDESADYEPYVATRAFYKKEGFYPLEVLTTFWDEDNPCLFMVRVVEG